MLASLTVVNSWPGNQKKAEQIIQETGGLETKVINGKLIPTPKA